MSHFVRGPLSALRATSPNFLGAHLISRRSAPKMLCIVGGAVERSETDDQQDVGSACERQDGKRVVGGLIKN